MNVSGGARKQAEALGLDVDTIATAVFGEGSQTVLEKQHVDTYAAEHGFVPAQAAAATKRTSKAAAARDPDDDPLQLDDNKIELWWPAKSAGPNAGKVRKRAIHIQYRPKQHESKVYRCLVNRVKRSSQGLPPRVRKLSEATLVCRKYDVVQSPRAGVSGSWKPAEEEALLKRTQSDEPESVESIGISLGRKREGARNKINRMTKYSEESPSSKEGTKQVRVGWRNVVTRAMELLGGTASTLVINDAISKKMPDVANLLDWSTHKGTIRWHDRVAYILSHHPEFEKTGEKVQNPAALGKIGGGQKITIWQYIPPVEGLKPRKSDKEINYIKHGPNQPRKETANKKSLNLVKAFRK